MLVLTFLDKVHKDAELRWYFQRFPLMFWFLTHLGKYGTLVCFTLHHFCTTSAKSLKDVEIYVPLAPVIVQKSLYVCYNSRDQTSSSSYPQLLDHNQWVFSPWRSSCQAWIIIAKRSWCEMLSESISYVFVNGSERAGIEGRWEQICHMSASDI